MHDLERRARALDEQSAERRERPQAAACARSINYPTAGALRLLTTADGAAELAAARHGAFPMTRVLARDLDELAAVRDAAREVDAEQARRQEALSHALKLASEAEAPEKPTGLAARQGRLPRPVPGPILHSFGAYRDRGIEVARRGAELESHPRQAVRAVAAARVLWVGEAPGLGQAVARSITGDGYHATMTGRIHPTVAVGELVPEGGAIGHATGGTVYFELAQEGTPVNPSPWLSRPLPLVDRWATPTRYTCWSDAPCAGLPGLPAS